MGRRATSWALGLRILCAVALLFLGLAHRPAMAALHGPLDIAAYTLPDGTLADICVNDRVDGKAKAGPAAGCEACRIGNAMLLPLPADGAGAALVLRHAEAAPPPEVIRVSRRDRPGAPPRAPPVLAA